jgi:hypothetical protein
MVLAMGTVELLDAPSAKSLYDVYAYWLAKKGAAIAPPRAALTPEEMVQWLPWLALLDVIGEPPRFRVRLFGTGLVNAYGEEITGKWMDECDLNWVTDLLLAQMTKVVRERQPNVLRARWTKVSDRRYLDYERIALPLSADGETINMILCAYHVDHAHEMARPP